MSLLEFFKKYMREDTPVCICSEKSMNILYSGSVGGCYFRLAKTTNFCSLYPALVDGEEIGIIVTLTPEYYEWRSKISLSEYIERCGDLDTN